jgi:hypothetical protein
MTLIRAHGNQTVLHPVGPVVDSRLSSAVLLVNTERVVDGRFSFDELITVTRHSFDEFVVVRRLSSTELLGSDVDGQPLVVGELDVDRRVSSADLTLRLQCRPFGARIINEG